MSNLGKKSPSRQKNDVSDTLIYIFLFLLLALLIGGIGWWVYDRYYKEEPVQPKVFNYEFFLGPKKNSPSHEEVSKLISSNRNTLKRINWALDDQLESKKLTEEEKEAVRAELSNIDPKFDEMMKRQVINEKTDPQMLKIIYDLAYDYGKILVRARDITLVRWNVEEAKRQKEEQKKWTISSSEKAEIDEKMNT
jgi:hypothetical protein